MTPDAESTTQVDVQQMLTEPPGIWRWGEENGLWIPSGVIQKVTSMNQFHLPGTKQSDCPTEPLGHEITDWDDNLNIRKKQFRLYHCAKQIA
jgi:hypothetical protein